MSATIKTSDKTMQTVTYIEYIEDGPDTMGEWRVALGDEGVDSTYEVFYQNRFVSRISGMFEVRAISCDSIRDRASRCRSRWQLQPSGRDFSPERAVGHGRARPTCESFEGISRAIKANPRV